MEMGKWMTVLLVGMLFLYACGRDLSPLPITYHAGMMKPVEDHKEDLVNQKLDEQRKLAEEKALEELKKQQPVKLRIEKLHHSVKNKIHREHDSKHLIEPSYTDIKGILTFRGNHYRDQTAIGTLPSVPQRLEILWKNTTGKNAQWGGGSGWTGQPLVIEWPAHSPIGVYEKFKNKENFTEVIQVSLDGNVYFYDLETGEESREKILIGNPIKGTPSLHPRGYPLLFVGEGIPQSSISLNIVNLITNNVIAKIPGLDPFAYRKWGAFDGSPLISKETDTMVTNGENGLIYQVKLNTVYDEDQGNLTINPQINKMAFTYPNQKHGIESSIISDGPYLFTADNTGMIQAVDAQSLETLWSVPAFDDTDATMILHQEDGIKYLYTASEIDLQGSKGFAKVRKIEASTGTVVWERDFSGYSIVGDHPINGGFLASPLKGEGNLEGQMIFTMARGNSLHSGYIVSLDQQTGQTVWQWEMEHYAWSSPAGITDVEGNFYIVQGDSAGKIFLIKNGTELIDVINVGANVEASPIIYENKIIVGTRGGHILAIEIN